ncbi:caspase family protein [Prevotellamassilia timonensis]|uniref:caspase family protein n=1 Tax=Prevotellamassilia timonensis TaxID=1852370 RepID=UPI0030771E0C
MNIAKATYCVRRVCTILFVILSVLCLSWPLASMAKKRALLIGISHYPQTTRNNPCTWTNIHGSNDVRLLRGTLQKQGFRITTLTNAQATASHIRRALKRLCQQAAKGDMVVIHFSGHGQPFEDLSGDEADGWDEAIVPYDAKKCYSRTYTGQCHIIDDELERYINSLRTTVGPRGFVYVVLDACHMGGASRDESETDSAACVRGTNVGFSPNGRTYIPRIDRRGHFTVKASPRMAGVCYIESCRAYQTNTEIYEQGQYYGPLSFYINQALQHTPLTHDLQWVHKVVEAMLHDKRLIKQNPVIETDR